MSKNRARKFRKRKYRTYTENYVKINENYETSIKNVFAGGDLVGNTATIAWAARDGRNAADKINYILLC